MTYAIDPLQPLPKRWKDQNGPLRLMTVMPVEGYVMARRLGAMPFVVSVRDLLGGKFTPHIPAKRINVRERVAEINGQHERAVKEAAFGGEE